MGGRADGNQMVEPGAASQGPAVEAGPVRTAIGAVLKVEGVVADRDIRVQDVVSAVVRSCRRLEQKFRRALGRTPLQEVHRAHLERAMRLLRETSDAIQDVSDAAGFSSPTRIGILLRRYLDLTPTEYREQLRRT